MGTSSKNSCKTAAVMNLLGKGAAAPGQEVRETAVRLEQELAELRSRPVDVAVQVDEAAENLVLFHTLLDQAQEAANKLGGVLLKSRDKDPETAAMPFRKVLDFSEGIKSMARGCMAGAALIG